MTQEEREIYNYLKTAPEVYHSAREIGRRTGDKDIRRMMPDWVVEHLRRMVRGGLLETDDSGHYRLKQRPKINAEGRKWVSPHIAKLLKNSSNDYSHVATTEITDLEEEF